MMRKKFLLCCLAMAVGVPNTQAEDWLRFRGPNGTATSDSELPVSWTPTENIAWKVDLPGAGVSSPIVVGDKVFVTCYSGYGLDRENPGDIEKLMRHVVCLDANTGEKVWQDDVPAVQPEDPYSGVGVPAHGYASHTPVSDGENVYVFFGKTGALAYTLSGEKLWHVPLGTESDPWKWGSSSSPIVHDDVVIVTASAESQAVVGLDKMTGKEVWRQEATMLDGVWSTPALVETSEGRTDLVMSVAKEIWGLDPVTGKLLWYSEATGADQSQSSPIVSGDVIYAVTGRGGGSVAVKAGGKGDVSESNQVWTGRDSARFASPVASDNKMYIIAEDRISVIDQASGERIGQERIRGGSSRGGGFMDGSGYPSPVIAGNKLYHLKGNGEMFVFDVANGIEQISVNLFTEDSEKFGGSPAISNGRMYVRSDKYLYCVADLKVDLQPNASEMLIAKLPASEEGGGFGGPGGGGRGGPGGGRGGPGGGRGGPGGGRGGPGGGFDPAQFFSSLDSDGDGKVTKAELEGNRLAERFDQFDGDSNGELTQEELLNGMRSMFRGPGGGGPGGGGRGGPGGGRGGYPGGNDNRPKRPERPSGL